MVVSSVQAAAPILSETTVAPTSTVKASSAPKVIGAFTVTNPNGPGADTIDQFTVENKTALTALTADIASVAIYSDGGVLGIIDGADAIACAQSTTNTTTNFNAGAPVINFTCLSPIAIGSGITQGYLAVITTTVGATDGRTMAAKVNAHLVAANAWGAADLETANLVTIDTVPPAAILVEDFVFVQNPLGTQDQIAPAPVVSIGMENSIIKVYQTDGSTLIGEAILGVDERFAPINIGDNVNASVKLQVVDPAGNTNTMIEKTGNDIVAPTVTSALAFTDRVIIQFSEQVDGMMAMNCSNYTVGGTVLTCGGMGLPFVDFQGDKATIRGLSLSGTTSLVIASGNTIKDINGANNPLTAYSSGSLTITTLVLPTISSLSVTSGIVGGSLTITGTNFGTLGGGTIGDANNKVFFSGGFDPMTGPLLPVEADYTGATWSATSILVKVPTGAQGGPVNVMVNGVMSDMNQNSFFDIKGTYTAKVWYDAAKTSAMADGYAANIRIVVAGMRGPVVYSTDGSSGNTMTYDTGTDTFTITGVGSMGWVWAYDITGAHLNAPGGQVNISVSQDLILLTTDKKISGTITLGTSCAAGGQNKDVVIFAMPDQVDTGGTGFKPMDPAFFRTGPTNGQTACQTTYSVGIPTNGIYRVEAHIPPDPTSATTSSSAFTDPDALSVTISGAGTVAGQNFVFPAATHRIVGTVQKPSGSFGTEESGMLWVFAYQPREGGYGTGTQVGTDGIFTLYVTPGTWKIGVGGPNMPFPVEVQVDVDDTYLIASAPKGPTIIIAPPSDFIEGYVKDSAGNGLANTSLYAWLEGGPGGGNAQTDSQGYYKMYVTPVIPGSNYHIGANSQSYGFLGEQSGIIVSSTVHPTVNFNVSSTDNYTISGTVTKNTFALQEAFVFITNGENGAMLGGGGTDATGAFSVRVSDGSNPWIHIGLPGQGEIYLASLGVISADTALGAIAITSSTIKVRIFPASSFTQAFVGVHSDTSGGFSDTPVVTADCLGSGVSCREFQIDVRQPASGTTTYYVDGGIPGYGPLPQISVGVANGGGFVDTSGTLNDGIIEITLGGLYTISGMVTGTNALDAWVFASGPNGGGGAAVDGNGVYSIQLRDGTYDIGVGKPGYIGNKITTIVSGADVPLQNLILTTATNTITGKVYLPDGVTTATNAWVWADNGSGGWAGGSTDASGNYTLNVGSGDWTIKAAYDGYNSTGTLVTAPASGKNITLITVSGFTPNTKNAPITPSDGGIVSGTGIKVDFPKNALGTGTSAGTVEVKSTTNVVSKNDRQMVGTAKEITARDSSNQNITTLSGSITIELTVSEAELVTAGLTFAQAQNTKITYFDSTGGSWVEIPTVATLSVPTATTIAGLNDDLAITFTGTTSHLSTYALSNATDADAPPTPTGLSITAGNGTAALSWTASAGATKYDIYKKVGTDYPYLAQTTSISYTATNLTNGTTYYFKVSALDNSTPNKESAAASFDAVTPEAPSSGGSSADKTAPTSTSVSINAGATTTASTSITLTLAATGASHMMISNDSAFTGASWETYATTKAWTLATGDGTKTVYAKFKDTAGNISTAVSDTITLGAVAVTTLPAGCLTGNLFSATTGLSCAITVLPAGCKTGSLFSTTTGLSCGVTTTPVAVPGCKTGDLFSATSGASCGATTTTTTTAGISETTTTTTTVTTPTTTPTVTKFTKSVATKSLKADVKNLQTALNTVLGTTLAKPLVVDGMFGPKSLVAVKAFQKANGLVVDGKFGPKSLAKLNTLLGL